MNNQSQAYTWVKDTNTNGDRCILDNSLCMLDANGIPVRFCSFQRNEQKAICKAQSSAEYQSSYRILGCYSTPDCGGNVPLDYTPIKFSCPQEELEKCGKDKPMEELIQNCIQLKEGTIPSSPLDQNYKPPNFCYLGRPPATYAKEKSPYYDPCQLSFRNKGIDLVPKACFNKHCCPGSF